ncbi:MAG: sigma factor-like helix-turn-helix DNA-binding protein [Desulfosporosinus sp.]
MLGFRLCARNQFQIDFRVRYVRAALKELNREELELIKNLYYRTLTVREIARLENISHVTVVKRHKKILDKLRKFCSCRKQGAHCSRRMKYCGII